MDPGAGAVVEHAVVAQVGHRGQRGGRRVVGVLGGLEGRKMVGLETWKNKYKELIPLPKNGEKELSLHPQESELTQRD